ncbi:ATP-binding protein [Streptomyces sp. NPDC085614]|uniref:ATP-binding protein n=1 Tax=Streptomyces sp. NPDC085614 TaxID=3365733 RepID=UPI0037D2BBFB
MRCSPMKIVEGCAHTPESMTLLRGQIRAGLTARGCASVVDDVMLVVTELIANASLHGDPPVTLSVVLAPADGAVRVEVGDAGRGMDVARVRARWRHPSFTLGERGRGLFLIDALCSGWGSRLSDDSHTIWAEIALPVGPSGADDAVGADGTDGAVTECERHAPGRHSAPEPRSLPLTPVAVAVPFLPLLVV